MFFLLLPAVSACTVQLNQRWDRSSAIELGRVAKVETQARDSVSPEAEIGGLSAVAMMTESESNLAFINSLLPRTMQVYTITSSDGRTTYFASEKSHIGIGDCVAIERGPSPNLRRVGDRYCDGTGKAKLSELETAATQCLLAKRQLMLAQTDTQLAAASRQVQALCQFGG